MLADGTLGELRSIARGLHPATMEKLGLSAALESMINEVDANTSIFFTHEIENIDGILSKEASLHVYRIVQEVLNNMVKHSEAKAASVTLGKEGDSIKAVIKDNGKGFDLSEKIYHSSSLGMKTLLERAKIIRSQLSIDSEKEKGTTILLLIPT
ncbi:MAG: ATP-binding protein, partial [Bacteroidota bacterium]